MITVSAEQLASTLPSVERGLRKYEALQAHLWLTDVRSDLTFQRAFNGFYRVRRATDWQTYFYAEFEREKAERRGFAAVVRELHEQMGRFEASFASKLVASVDPDLPIIDTLVLRNLGLSLPAPSSPRRLDGIVDTYAAIRRAFEELQASEAGEAALAAFDLAYPSTMLTSTKKLDLMLWQLR